MLLLPGLSEELSHPEVWAVEHHLAFQRVQWMVDDVRKARSDGAHGEFLTS